MRKLLFAVIATALLHGTSGAVGLAARRGEVIVIEGTILAMSPVLGREVLMMSHPYRLVKYRVDGVCKGKYKGGEIILEHTLVMKDGFKDRKVGDRVYALAWRKKRKETGTIHTYPGIRESVEGIKDLYDGGQGVLPAAAPSCSFTKRELLSAS
jgi:hypothetical protein